MQDASLATGLADDASAEQLMADKAIPVGVMLAVGAVAIALPLRGLAAALTALGAVVVVVGNFVVTGRSLAWAATKSLPMLQGVALGGLLVRLVLYGILLVVLGPVEAIDGPVLAITVATATIVLLTYETRFVLQTSQLWWLDDNASAGGVAPVAHGKERP
ncbi:MAG: hypothetical protein R3343_02920 [Nitriliruptorales bacterium]|nr:hypothetical protein [Nitriliruptorales bacterium]